MVLYLQELNANSIQIRLLQHVHTCSILELNGIWVRALPGPMHLGIKTGPLCPMFCTKRSPFPLAKFQMAPIVSFLISSGSKKKEPRYVCMSEAKASHSHKMWTEVSSSVLHFLQVGLLLSPIIYRGLLKVLCPVSRPVTTLDCVLLKDIIGPLWPGQGQRSILEPVSMYYNDHTTIPDAVFPSSISSFFLYSA
jgi:hypothetical protein